MHYKFLSLSLLISMALTGCALFEKPASTTMSEFDIAYTNANSARHKASELGMEWRDTHKLLSRAKKAESQGKSNQAIELINEALIQSELAIEQFNENKQFLQKIPLYDPKATPREDQKNMKEFFHWKFPDLSDEDFSNGMYAHDESLRDNWLAIEEFPPYFPAIDEGEIRWSTPFKNGKYYGNCFGFAGVANKYPMWDKEIGTVVTLEMAINACRIKNGEWPPLEDGKNSELLAIASYMAYKSRGKPINVIIPEDDPRALEAYNKGKEYFFSRRGQLNLACYQCHFSTAGQWLRSNMLGTALGQTSHFPIYRSSWGSMGSLHRRYKGCNKQVRAKPDNSQSEAYRNLEFFHSYMSNGILLNGPGARF